MDMSILIIWMSPFIILGFTENILNFTVFCIEIPISNQCRPDQMPSFAASEMSAPFTFVPKTVFGQKGLR